MLPVLTPDEMRKADERAIATGTPGSVLMDRAGRAVAWAVRRHVGSMYGLRVVALCGKGNNGGDGLIAADVLERWGARVTRVAIAEGVDRRALERELHRTPIVIDAMFGTGFSGSLGGEAAWAARAVADSGASVVAVDIPSGVDGATGAVEGVAVMAHRTVVMAALKTGVVQEPGRTHAGQLEVAPIGIDTGPCSLGVTEPSDVRASTPSRDADANKWSVGGVLVVGGADGMTGAPLLVSHAALRSGAGIVWCEMPADAAASASGTEVITKTLPTTEGAIAPEAAAVVAEHAERFGAAVVGPGLGTAPGTASAVRSIVSATPCALVLDADGLNALAGDLSQLRARGNRATVLTPHGGEYARLAGRAVGADRIAAARDLAAHAEAIVVLKGPGTVIAAPDGRAAVNPTGSSALATAGTGDVLAGVIGGLLARGVPPFEAAVSAVYVHGAAADLLGPHGLVAPDLLDALPIAFEALDARGADR